MQKIILVASGLLTMLLLIISCAKETDIISIQEAPIPEVVLNNITRLGLSNDGVKSVEGGYLVEGDIFMDEVTLQSQPEEIRVPTEEQYHTFNLVKRLPRNFKVWVNPALAQVFIDGTDAAIARYAAENIQITFVRVTKKGGSNIKIDPDTSIPLASAGFPTNGGSPYKNISVNPGQAGLPLHTWTSIIAHEMGHCIGFRHTDWYDRSISCGFPPVNEGQEINGIGAVHIPGTSDKFDPDADPGSWMLSCIGAAEDRPFTVEDKIALNYLYQ